MKKEKRRRRKKILCALAFNVLNIVKSGGK
jgi:hypothetical protein